MAKSSRHLSAEEAAQRLGVRRTTLYAYVSRGLVRSVEGLDSRSRFYLLEDIEALRDRKRQRQDPTSASRGALDWGLPVLDSALTRIEDGSFYYRGRDVCELSRRLTIEQVAALLWLGDEYRSSEMFPARLSGLDVGKAVRWGSTEVHPAERMHAVLRWAAVQDLAAFDLRSESVARCGARLLTALIEGLSGQAVSEDGLGPALVRWLGAGKESAARPIVASLVLCADHELNVSSFTARCVASAGSNPYEVVTAGLAALRGFRHGGHSDRVEELLLEMEVGRQRHHQLSAAEIRRRLSTRLERGERLPGFGQPLYPDGDPRYRELRAVLGEAFPDSEVLATSDRVIAEGTGLIDRHPTIDFGLATVSAQLGLGRGGAWTLFALGRCIGWVAHAIEEYERGLLIRPRARYVGRLRGPEGTA